jgi:hypothetical protein
MTAENEKLHQIYNKNPTINIKDSRNNNIYNSIANQHITPNHTPKRQHQ